MARVTHATMPEMPLPRHAQANVRFAAILLILQVSVRRQRQRR